MKRIVDERSVILDGEHLVFFQLARRAFNPLLNESERAEAIAHAEQAFRNMRHVENRGK